MYLAISFLPIILPLVLLVFLKTSARNGMLITFIVVSIASYFYWGMDLGIIFASIIQGIHKSLGILLILFGAIILLNVLKLTGAMEAINQRFCDLTKDMRLQVILIAFLLGSLIEGVSGFGTPAVVVAPLLLALGFQPIISAAIALIADSVPVSFGAVGTPIQVGLSNIQISKESLLEIAQKLVQIDLLCGFLIPTILVATLIIANTSNKKSYKTFIEVLPFAITIGLLYQLIALTVVHFIGFEFVSIITPIIMIVITFSMIKLSILTPKNIWTTQEQLQKQNPQTNLAPTMPIFQAWLAYILVVIVLVLSRTVPIIKTFALHTIDLSYNQILSYDINSSLQVLYNPGFILSFIAFITIFIHRAPFRVYGKASFITLKTMANATVTLLPTLAMVQIFTNSGLSKFGQSMPIFLAKELGTIFYQLWYSMAPYIGMLGSFISGSATVSNLTFSQLQFELARNFNLDTTRILALGTLGAAIGNMICIHNIVSVSAVTGVTSQEGTILKKTIIPALLYGLLAFISSTIWR